MGLKNPFGSARPQQTLIGERRTPVYNAVDEQKIAAAKTDEQQQRSPAVLPPMVTTPSTGNTVKNDPYDVDNTPSAHTDTTAASLGTLNPAPVKIERGSTKRKPLPENVYPAQTGEQNASTDATKAAASRPSFFESIFSSPSDKKLENAASGVSEEEKEAPYATLSSAPRVSSRFKSIKASRETDMHDLQDDQADARAREQQLVGEPSQEHGVSVVEMPKPEATKTIEPTPALPQRIPEPSEQQTLRLPKRGVDIMTQAEWDAWQEKRRLQQSMKAAEQNFTPAPGNSEDQDKDAGTSIPLSTTTILMEHDGGEPAEKEASPALDDDHPTISQPSSKAPESASQADEDQVHRASFFSRMFGQKSTSETPDSAAKELPTPVDDNSDDSGKTVPPSEQPRHSDNK